MSDNYLAKLRKKPRHVRDNIAFGAASGFTGFVLIAWLVMAPGSSMFRREISTEDSPKFFKTFLNQFNEQVAGVKEAVPDKDEVAGSAPASTNMLDIASSSVYDPYATTSVRKEVFIMPISGNASGTATTTASSTGF